MTDNATIDLEISSLAFCGPLALLLELIEKRRLPITRVSLAEVADQYLERMHSMAGTNADLIADFLSIGARLLLIKSRALLPAPPREETEEDPAVDLEQRLLEYRIFKEAAELLRTMEDAGRRTYPRLEAPDYGGVEPPLEPVPPDALAKAMARMLKALEPEADRLALAPRVTVEERIADLVATLTSRRSARFSELAGKTVDHIVATFLAILELMRRGMLIAEQEAPFAEITVSLLASRDGGVPVPDL